MSRQERGYNELTGGVERHQRPRVSQMRAIAFTALMIAHENKLMRDVPRGMRVSRDPARFWREHAYYDNNTVHYATIGKYSRVIDSVRVNTEDGLEYGVEHELPRKRLFYQYLAESRDNDKTWSAGQLTQFAFEWDDISVSRAEVMTKVLPAIDQADIDAMKLAQWAEVTTADQLLQRIDSLDATHVAPSLSRTATMTRAMCDILLKNLQLKREMGHETAVRK